MLAEITLSGGARLHVPNMDELTLGEWRRLKQETGLASLQFVEAMAAGDPDALLALLTLAARRENVLVSERELEAENLLSLMQKISEALTEQGSAVPATAAAEGGSPAGTSSPETTPGAAGSSPSPPSSDFAPMTSTNSVPAS